MPPARGLPASTRRCCSCTCWVVRRATARGFEFIGADRPATGEDTLAARDWLTEGLQARIMQPAGAATLRLGPEPLIPAQTLSLSLNGRALRLVTDGFGPFRIQADAPGSP